MLNFTVNLQDLNPDGSTTAQDTENRKKPPARGDHVKASDVHGNVCYGIVEKYDAQTGVVFLLLDKSTWVSVTH